MLVGVELQAEEMSVHSTWPLGLHTYYILPQGNGGLMFFMLVPLYDLMGGHYPFPCIDLVQLYNSPQGWWFVQTISFQLQS